MVNWNSRAIKKGMVLGGILEVVRVSEKGALRLFHMGLRGMPAGFDVSKPVVLTVPSSEQDITLAEANGG